MRCHVLLFAQLREAIGRDRVTVDLPENATISDALDALANGHPPIASMRSHLAVAVDERSQPRTAALRDECTIALIPPVSGG
jgi:molybdopterin converting factor subunit 1